MKAGHRKLTPFGRQVKKRLVDMEITQVELAEMLGTNKQYINKILCGERSGKKYISEISKILKIESAA